MFIKETLASPYRGARDDGKTIFSPHTEISYCQFHSGWRSRGNGRSYGEGTDNPGEASIWHDVCVVAHTKAVKTTYHELMDIGLPSLLYVHTHLLNMNGRDLALILIMNTLMMMWFSIFTWTSKA